MTPMENMLGVMNIPRAHISSVCLTSDGHYLGQKHNDIGYNHFLGKPSHHDGLGRDSSLARWSALSPQEQADVLALAASPPDGAPIPILDFPGLKL